MTSLIDVKNALKTANNLWNIMNNTMQELRKAQDVAAQKLQEYQRTQVGTAIQPLIQHSPSSLCVVLTYSTVDCLYVAMPL